ncbi:MAG: hypothetical protein IKM32_00050 [Clostridia bacterium]|nr:hypothetical protein [Clostridia bacterium]
MKEHSEGFNYTYSAKEQEEIKAIRSKYSVKEEKEDKMAQLRRLDCSVGQKAQAVAIALGVIGALLLGVGMSLIMSDFANILGEYLFLAMPIGIVIGVIGMVLTGLAYPIYNYIIKKERERVAPEILRLTDELLK